MLALGAASMLTSLGGRSNLNAALLSPTVVPPYSPRFLCTLSLSTLIFHLTLVMFRVCEVRYVCEESVTD